MSPKETKSAKDKQKDSIASHETPMHTYMVVPPDGGWGWVVVAASFCCNMVVDGIIYSFGMFLGVISESFDESKAKVSLVGSLLSGFYLMEGKIYIHPHLLVLIIIIMMKKKNIFVSRLEPHQA